MHQIQFRDGGAHSIPLVPGVIVLKGGKKEIKGKREKSEKK